MKIFALIPDNYLREAESCHLEFETKCVLGKNAVNEMTLIVRVKDADGKTINGTQYIADLNEPTTNIHNVSNETA